MRLTLRTLLAYLDDVLEPSQTREIGQKIQESPVAAALVSRIREVIRRRRLGAPDLDGASQGIEPNIVAQYLDNTLREDRVADVERVCLESDQHLAEVAACHQILTLVLGEPQDLTPERLDRMYALGPVPAGSLLSGTAAAHAEPPVPTPAGSTASVSQFRDNLPEYLRPSPWSQRMAPAALFAVVVVAAVLALALDRDLAKTVMGLRPDSPQNNAVANAETDAPPDASRPPSPKPTTSGKPAVAAPSTDVVAMTDSPLDDRPISVLPEGIDPPPPPDQPERVMPAATTPPPAAVAPPAVAASEKPPVVVAEATRPMPAAALPAAPMPVEAPVAEPVRIRVPMRYTSTDGILMRFDPRDSHWLVQPRRSELHATETFGSPDPFEAHIDLDEGVLQLTLLVDSVCQILPATEDRRIRLEMLRGRALLERTPGGKSQAALTIDVQAGPRLWSLELAAGANRCALDMQPARPMGLPLPQGAEAYRLALFVPEGRVVATTEGQPAVTVAAGEMVWLNRPQTDSNALTDPHPAWLDAQQRAGSASLRRYAQLFEREFDPATPIDLSIPALIKDPRPKIAELATRCLGTTESYTALITALVRSEHVEARAAAAMGLRAWLVEQPERAEVLRQELGKHYPEEESRAVFQLLTGFQAQAAQDATQSLQLVEWLRSNYVEVRELAIEQIEFMTGRRYDYRATGSPSQREPAIQRWIAHIEREGALVRAAP